MRLVGGLGDQPRALTLTAAKRRAERMVKMTVKFISRYQEKVKVWTVRKPRIEESKETRTVGDQEHVYLNSFLTD